MMQEKGKLNKLELIVMERLLRGESRLLEKLREQFAQVESVKREYTGAGFFTYFQFDKNDEFKIGNTNAYIGDVEAMLKGMTESVGFILFIKNGWIDNLEGYTYTEDWPKNPELLRLAYWDNERSMRIVEKQLTGQSVTGKSDIDWDKAERFD